MYPPGMMYVPQAHQYYHQHQSGERRKGEEREGLIHWCFCVGYRPGGGYTHQYHGGGGGGRGGYSGHPSQPPQLMTRQSHQTNG